MLRLRCPSCRRVFASEKFEAGKRYRCPQCRTAALEPAESASGAGSRPADPAAPGPSSVIVPSDPSPPAPGRRKFAFPLPQTQNPEPTTQNPQQARAPDQGGAATLTGATLERKRTESQDEPATISLDISSPVPVAPGSSRLALAGEPPRRPEPSGSFGKYALLKELGRGGMGIVYLAEDPSLKRKVALKVLIAGEGAAESTIKRFAREAQSSAKLRHPSIVGLHESGEFLGRPYFTMDYVEGVTLAQRLKAGKIDPREALELVKTLALALAYAHGQGIIHRDLKPSNVLLTRDGQPHLMDFGLARDVSGDASMLSVTGNIFGTPAYMSPEQAMGKVHEIDARSDVFSLGIMLYEMLAGSNPFQGDTVYNTITQVIERDPRPLHDIRPNLAADLATIVEKCLRKEPVLRYQSMEELAGDLLRYLAGEPLAARREGAVSKARRAARKNPAVVKAIAAGLALAALVGILVAFLGRKSEVDRFLGAVKDPKGEVRHLVLKTFVERMPALALQPGEKARALAAIREALRDPEPKQRAFAASVAGTLGDTLAGPELVAMAETDSSEAPRVEALRSLGALKAVDSLGRIGALLKNRDTPRAARVEAARALGRIGGFTATQLLLADVLAEDVTVRAEVRTALDGIRPTESILSFYGTGGGIPAATQGLVDLAREHADHQAEIEEALGMLNPEAVPQEKPLAPFEALCAKLAAADPSERRMAAYDLGALGDARAAAVLFRALEKEEDAAIAGLAVASLQRLNAAGTSALNLRLGDGSPAARRNAALVIEGLAYREALPTLRLALEAEKSKEAREAMIGALGRIGEPADSARLSRLLPGSEPSTQIRAVEALSRLGEKKACRAIVPFLSSPEPALREAAFQALRALTGQSFGPDAAGQDLAKWEDLVKEF